MSSRQVGIVLLPDQTTDGFVRGLSRALPNNGLVLGTHNGSRNTGPYPHVSLFHMVADSSQLDELWGSVVGRVQDVSAQDQFAYELHSNACGWSFLEVQRTLYLLDLQRRVLRGADAYRVRPVRCSWTDQFTPAQRRAYERWGYPNVRYAWPPHFTFGKTRGGDEHRSPCRWIWIPLALALVGLGPHGSAAEILNTFIFPPRPSE